MDGAVHYTLDVVYYQKKDLKLQRDYQENLQTAPTNADSVIPGMMSHLLWRSQPSSPCQSLQVVEVPVLQTSHMGLWWIPPPLAAEEAMKCSYPLPREKLLCIVAICGLLPLSLSQQKEEAHAQV